MLPEQLNTTIPNSYPVKNESDIFAEKFKTMTDALKNNKKLSVLIESVAEVAGYIWQKGWAEKNAGNISINLKDVLTIPEDYCRSLPHRDLAVAAENLSGTCFLVTGTGKRMRDIARNTMANVLIIRVDESGRGFHIIEPTDSDLLSSLRPTSELPSHLSIHSMNTGRGSKHKVVIHTHANELCALTQASEFCDEKVLNRILWGMHPETKVFIPEGVGFVPYYLPGSVAIAMATVEVLRKHDVALWEKHGVFAIGDTIDNTFDLIDILAKSASIFFTCRAAGIEPEGLTDNQIDELGKLIF
jgi:rhamnulose-1-phosphate aldolase